MKIVGGKGMRIIGGDRARQRMKAPAGTATRPTLSRVREALFNTIRTKITEARILDLYAGSGAVSLEALSWGAAVAVLVEPDKKARATIRANVQALGLEDRVTLRTLTAERELPRLIAQGDRFDVIFCDPPWQRGISAEVRQRMLDALAQGGWIVVEHPAKAPAPELEGVECFKQRSYGDTALAFYRRPSAG